jgi:hypothetical protein
VVRNRGTTASGTIIYTCKFFGEILQHIPDSDVICPRMAISGRSLITFFARHGDSGQAKA